MSTTMQDNTHGQYIQAEVVSSPTPRDKLRTRIRYILDTLTEHVQLPYGMTLEGRVTNDRHGNSSLYVFLRDRDGGIHPGERPDSQTVRYIPETVGGHWISLNKGDGNINYQWEARDLNKAVAEYRLRTSK